jgi:serine/threonine protein kinase/WD40 repeat protein/tetratricopeptide (TPR) repeat protein
MSEDPQTRTVGGEGDPSRAVTVDAPAGLSTPSGEVVRGEGPGATIGPYRLLEQIGEGGMGVVFLAEQTQPVRRRVALKILKPGMDSRQVIARFEAERQALALMDHPNIARVLDAGTVGSGQSAVGSQEERHRSLPTAHCPLPTDSGRPFFVMELVSGAPITQFCDKNGLAARQRLGLFLSVCSAVQHAHTKGIIHRDIKPSNVLVAVDDGAPVVKVIDFGIAKAIDQPLTDRTVLTQVEQVVGTPLYMSPEQAGLGGLDVDTRSDVYSLGVLLYELLTGSTPFAKERLQKMPFDEVRRVIREEEPPRPSLRLLREEGRGKRDERKKLLSSSLIPHPSSLRELDWVVMKALEKDRARRYETAAALAADVRRYLNDEPVLACPPSAAYRFGKFARRNRAALTAAAVVAAALLVATGISIHQAVLARQAETAERRAREARDVALGEKDAALGEKDEALGQMKKARGELQINLADMYATQGVIAADRGNAAQAALWFGNAARLAGLDGRRVEANRIRAENWGRLAPRPVAAVVHAAEWLESMAFHPAGLYLLTHGHDPARGEGECQLWDLQRQQTVAIPGAGKVVSAAAWDSSGGRLAAGSPSGEVVIARFPGGELVGRFALKGRVHHLLFSPDGRYLAAAQGKSVRVWDTRQGAFATPALPHTGRITTLAFHPEGRLLATACEDHSCRVFAVPGNADAPLFEPVRHFQEGLRSIGQKPMPPLFVDEGRELLTFSAGIVSRRDPLTGRSLGSLGENRYLASWAVSPDGALAVLGGVNDGRVWNLHTRAAVGTAIVQRPHQYMLAAAFSPKGDLLATASGDHAVRLWSVLEGKPVGEAVLHPASVDGVAFSPAGTHLATAQRGGMIRLWRLPNPAPEVRVPCGGNSLVRLSGDGRYLLPSGVSQRSGSLLSTRVYETATGKPAGPALNLGGRLIDAALSPDGRHAATVVSQTRADGWQYGKLALWSWRDGKLAAGPVDLPSEPRKLDYNPAGTLLAVVCAGGELLLVDPSGGKTVRQWRAHDPYPANNHYVNNGAVRFSPEGDRVITYGTNANAARFWDVQGKLLFELRHRRKCHDVRFSADRQFIVTASYDSTACVWDAATGERLAVLTHPDWVFSAVFDDAGKRVLTACRDGMARLWDWKSGTLVCPAFEHEHEIHAAEFLAGGRFVVTTGEDQALRLWETVTGKLIGPPVALEGQGMTLAITPDGRRAAVGGFMPSLPVIELASRLSPGKRSAEELCLVGEVHSGQRVHEGGGVTNLSPEEWHQRWRLFPEGRPGYPAQGPEARLAWQRQIAESHVSRGQTFLSRARPDEAIAAFRYAGRVQPGLVTAHWYLGRALTERGPLSEAIASYRKAVKLAPEHTGLHYELGNALRDHGKVDEAIAEFRRAIQLSSTFPEAHCNLGHVLRDQGKFTEALASLRRGHELGMRTSRWRYRSDLWVQRCERLVEMERTLASLLEGKGVPHNQAERVDLAWVCHLKGYHATAARFYEEAFAKQPALMRDVRLGHRYNAACAMAQAGCGLGKDEAALDEAARARWRGQALVWLQAELAVHAAAIKGGRGSPRASPQQALQRWQKEPALAGVRDREALAKLPEAERRQWRRFWDEVGTLGGTTDGKQG